MIENFSQTFFPMKKYRKYTFYCCTFVFCVGLVWPAMYTNPVKGMKQSSFHPDSFWYYPWGKSVTHKGIDIFAGLNTGVTSVTNGLVVYSGTMSRGGKVVLVLGPKWRLHYYAHLNQSGVETLEWVGAGETIGGVGNTGNAQGKPYHLHYSVVTLIPYFWRIDDSRQGWKKMFYLNPKDYFSV
tara:strand:+ start:3731 stop:4279 length:549 start_codon:yes stop_codon:yes gene_type:complete